IQISGGYLHFLPVYLRTVPVPDPGAWAALGPSVAALQASPDEAQAEAVDDAVMAAYRLGAADRRRVRAHTDRQLGFAPELLARH
ncbi:MAG: hypothetical protein AAF211_32000, partial [Myxococcota bacterium]